MKVEGRSIDFIHQELGVQKRTLYLWFSDDKMKAEIDRLISDVERLFAERMASAGMRALDEMVEFAESNGKRQQAHCETCGWFDDVPKNHGNPDNPCTGPYRVVQYITEGSKLKALDSIMDRVAPTARHRDKAEMVKAENEGGGGGGGDTNFNALFANMNDEQLADALKLWGMNGNGQPAIEP